MCASMRLHQEPSKFCDEEGHDHLEKEDTFVAAVFALTSLTSLDLSLISLSRTTELRFHDWTHVGERCCLPYVRTIKKSSIQLLPSLLLLCSALGFSFIKVEVGMVANQILRTLSSGKFGTTG